MTARLSEAALIGAGIVDIPLVPVRREMFDGTGSHSLERIALGVGGDALNEAMLLTRLGHPAMLVSVIGEDAAGDIVLRALDEAGVDRGCVVRRPGLDTGVNVVMVRGDGERGFITSRSGSLRRLCLSDILPALETPAFAGVKCARDAARAAAASSSGKPQDAATVTESTPPRALMASSVRLE